MHALNTNCGKMGKDNVKNGSNLESKLFYKIFITVFYVVLHKFTVLFLSLLLVVLLLLLLLGLVFDTNAQEGALRMMRIIVYAHLVIA